MSHTYLFVLGRTPELAYRELKSFFKDALRIHPSVVQVVVSHEIQASQLIGKLGGTVKIARLVGIVSRLNAQELVALLPTEKGEIHFGVSIYGDLAIASILADMKKLLEGNGIRARYAASRHGETLSTVTVDKRHISELVVVKTKEGFVIGLTLAVQPYEQWSKRDYDRPYADPKSGMLPPKVARMIVNIARPQPFATKKRPLATLLDPFCGMGTVLSEAYLSGFRVMGSDKSAEVLSKARVNLNWIAKLHTGDTGEVGRMFISDAVHVSDVLLPQSIDAIVTEPFMGSTRWGGIDKLKEVKNIIKGLEKLYIGCLRDWSKVLTPKGIIVIALPEYAVGGRLYFVKKVIDMCEKLGYTIDDGPIAYSRPQAIVRRMFFVLRKS